MYFETYFPPVLLKNKEFQAISEIGDYASEKIENDIQKEFDNQFIFTCNTEGIKRFEKILDIVPNPSDSLEVRRQKVLIKKNNELPYTYKKLIATLNSIVGEGNYSIEDDFGDDFNMFIFLYGINRNVRREVDKMLDIMIPCNINMDVAYSTVINGNNYQGGYLDSTRKTRIN